MSKFGALYTFLKLVVILGLITTIIHTLLRLYGLGTPYARLDHDVIKNVSNYIYLNKDGNNFVDIFSDDSLHERLQKTQFFNLHSTDHPPLTVDPDKECFFISLNFDSSKTTIYENILKPLESKDCVFIQSNYTDVYNYFRKHKPRWFYGARHADFMQFIFLNSIGLETIAPLKADFVIIDQSLKSKTNSRLFNELGRRQIILFSFK